MSSKAELLLNILHSEYVKRVNSNENYTDDSARMFNISELCDTYNLEHALVDELAHELKQYGYIQKWITGTIVLLGD